MMLERGFLKKKKQADPKPNRFISIASSTMLYLGVIILITSLIYMLVNLDRSEAIIGIWIIFLLAGLFLVVMSHMLKWMFK